MAGYKVRLGDGSQIGPLDEKMLRSWYEQGLIANDSPVLKPGAGRWVPLAQVVDVRGWKGGSRVAAARPGEAKPAPGARVGANGGRSAVMASPAALTRPTSFTLPRLPRHTLTAAFVLVGLAVAAAGYQVLTRDPLSDDVRPFVLSERRFADEPLGITLEPPRGWFLLRQDNPVVMAPPEARAILIQPRLNGGGFLTIDPAPRGAASLERYQERLLEQRRQTKPTLTTVERGPLEVGKVAARRSVSTWQDGGKTFRELTAVWRDGWTHLALVIWFPEERASSADKELSSLLGAFAATGVLAGRIEQAVSRATAEAPHLSREVALRLMGESEAGALEPEETFRRASLFASSGLAALAAAEFREMGQLTTLLYATVAARDRGRLASYLEKVRARRLSTADEDREMCAIMKTAFLKLPEPRRSRFRALYEKAVHAGLDKG
jgi:GYF domain 2